MISGLKERRISQANSRVALPRKDIRAGSRATISSPVCCFFDLLFKHRTMRRSAIFLILLTCVFNSCDSSTEPNEPIDQSVELDLIFAGLNQPENSIAYAVIRPGDTVVTLVEPTYSEVTAFAIFAGNGAFTNLSIKQNRESVGELWIEIPGAAGIGSYTLDSVQAGPKRAQFFSDAGRLYTQFEGTVTITEFDTLGRKLSGTLDTRMVSSGNRDSIHLLVRFKSIDLSTMSTHNAASMIFNGDSYSNSFGNQSPSAFFKSSQELRLIGHWDRSVTCERDREATESNTVEIILRLPAVGTFTQTDAHWRYDHTFTAESGAGCFEPSYSYEPNESDVVKITSYDPINRRISGSFTLQGLSGEFKDLTWMVYE
jgi:hypothetical protein